MSHTMPTAGMTPSDAAAQAAGPCPYRSPAAQRAWTARAALFATARERIVERMAERESAAGAEED